MIDEHEGIKIGFLTIQHDAGEYVGGLLTTNDYGLPLEFLCTKPVAPSRLQRILYGDILEYHLTVELIGKTILSSVNVPPSLFLVKEETLLDLRKESSYPIAFIGPNLMSDDVVKIPDGPEGQSALDVKTCSSHPNDKSVVKEILEVCTTKMSITEPFVRIEAAIKEARKSGMDSKR